jgi:hypothetical protein
MALKFANCTTWVGEASQLIKDEAWDADDPIVQARPELFDDEPTVVRGVRKRPEGVEEATAAPGEKRTRTRRA